MGSVSAASKVAAAASIRGGGGGGQRPTVDLFRAAVIVSENIHQAARTGDVVGMRALLDAIPPDVRRQQINALDETGSATLHYAARFNHFAIAKLLGTIRTDDKIFFKKK